MWIWLGSASRYGSYLLSLSTSCPNNASTRCGCTKHYVSTERSAHGREANKKSPKLTTNKKETPCYLQQTHLKDSNWEVTPGQLTHKVQFGAGSNSFNAQGMGLEKHRDDIFRHWLLGIGSGDLKIGTSGATREQIDVLNVLFIGAKVEAMQRLIAEVPEGPSGEY